MAYVESVLLKEIARPMNGIEVKMFIDEEDETRLLLIGLRIKRLQGATQDIRDCFFKDGKPIYEKGTDDMMQAINLYIKGESADYIADTFQSDTESVIKLFKLFGINDSNTKTKQDTLCACKEVKEQI